MICYLVVIWLMATAPVDLFFGINRLNKQQQKIRGTLFKAS